MEAVILAGGRGTRLRPLTDARPKPLIPFMGEPFVIGLVRRLVQAGVHRATLLVGSDAAAWQPLVQAGASLGAQVRVQTEQAPLDTAGACRQLFDGIRRAGGTGPVLVCNGDVLTDLDYAALVRQHREAKAVATIHLVPVPDTSSFGVAVSDAEGRITRFVEKPRPGTLAANTINGGTYVLDTEVFSEFPGDGPLSFERAVFPGLVEAGELVLGVEAGGYWQDLGTPRRYLDGHRAVLEGRCSWPLAPGLRILEDTLVAVHESARVSWTATLGPMAVVGAGCLIGPAARIVDSVLHDRVGVGGGACISGGILGERVQIAARAILVPGAVLRDHSVVTRVYGR